VGKEINTMKKKLIGPKLMLLFSFIIFLSSIEKGGWALVSSAVGFVGFLVMVILLQTKVSKTKN
jgi:hypothetical protein